MDPLIAIGSIIAITFLIILNWLLGGWAPVRIEDAELARQRFSEDYWDADIADVQISRDSRAALLSIEADSAMGLVLAMGDKMVTRKLSGHDIRSVHLRPLAQGFGLAIALKEFSFRPFMITFDERNDALRWKAMIEDLPGPALQPQE